MPARSAMRLLFAVCLPAFAISPAGGASETLMRMRATAPQPQAAAPVFRFVGLLTCTASLIGRTVILTAAHCVVDRPTASLKVAKGAGLVQAPRTFKVSVPGVALPTDASCFVHGEYIHTAQGDVALCAIGVASKAVPLRVSLNALLHAPQRRLTLVGTGAGNGAPRNVGVQVRDRVSPSSIRATGGGQTVLGDSGSPAIAVENGRRVVVGVMERDDDVDVFIAPLTVPVTAGLLKLWAQASKPAICGLSAAGCQ